MRTLLTALLFLTTLCFVISAGSAQANPGQQSQSPASAPAPKAAATAQAGSPAASSPSPSPFKDETGKLSYALGMNLGTNFHKQSLEIDPKLLLQGFEDAMSGGKTLMTEEEMVAALRQLQTELRAKAEAKKKTQFESNRKEGEAFLAANKTREGVVTLPDGLQYKVLTEGTGPKPGPEDTVVCNYRGTLIDGTEFDSSYKRGQPATFQLNAVIRGWSEALQLMHVGSKWQLFIPPDLAYGDRGAGEAIGPNATLIFEVELVSIRGKW